MKIHEHTWKSIIYLDLCWFICVLRCWYKRFMCLSLECPISVPAALRRPQEKHDPAFLDHVPYGFCHFLCVFSLVCPISVPAALRRPQKKHAPGVLDHVPYVFCNFLCVFSLVCPISVPAALRRPQKKHAPGILDHVPYVFCHFLCVFFNNFWCLECYIHLSLHFMGPSQVPNLWNKSCPPVPAKCQNTNKNPVPALPRKRQMPRSGLSRRVINIQS